GMHDGVILATTATTRTRPGGSSNLDTQTMEIVRVHAVEFSKTAAPLSGGASPSRARRPSSPHRALEERAGQYSARRRAGIGLVLHGGDRDRRAACGDADDSLLRAGGAHDARHALGQVDDVAVTVGPETQHAAVDRHARAPQACRSRRKRRLPTWRIAPSRRS